MTPPKKKAPIELDAAGRFVIVVGRDYQGGAPAQTEARMRTKLRDSVLFFLAEKWKVDFGTAMRAADLVVADRLHRPGETVVYLTAPQLAIYLDKAANIA